MIGIEAIFVGEPKNITDENGTWLSAIYRSQVQGTIELLESGLAGDPHIVCIRYELIVRFNTK